MKTLDKLVVKLNNISKVDLKQPLTQACLYVEGVAKEKCPVDTGNLRNSITTEVRGNTGYIGTNVDYFPYVEFGTGLYAANGDGRQDVPWRYKTPDGQWHTTSGQKPQPFLQPALLECKEEVEDILKRGIKEAIKKC